MEDNTYRHPLRRVAALWATVAGGVGAVVAGLVTAGWLSSDQGVAVSSTFTAADLTISAVIGLVTAGAAAVGSFSTAKQGERDVTPLVDPRDNNGRKLT